MTDEPQDPTAEVEQPDLSQLPPPLAPIVLDEEKPPRPELLLDWELKRRRLLLVGRIVLLIPHLFVYLFFGIGAFFIGVFCWFYALVRGHLPAGGTRYLSGFLSYMMRLNAYSSLLTDKYPPFALHEASDSENPYPVQIQLFPGTLSRWAVFFRFLLLFPANFIAGAIGAGLGILTIGHWFFALFTGRSPQTLYQANAIAARYSFRMYAYMSMLSSRYPVGPFGDSASTLATTTDPSAATLEVDEVPEADAALVDEALTATTTATPAPPTRPIFVRTKAVLAVLIVSGVLGLGTQAITQVLVTKADIDSSQEVIDDANEIIQVTLRTYNAKAQECAQDQSTYPQCIDSAADALGDAFDAMADDVGDVGLVVSRGDRDNVQDATEDLARIFHEIADATSTEEIASLETATEPAFKAWSDALDAFVE